MLINLVYIINSNSTRFSIRFEIKSSNIRGYLDYFFNNLSNS